MMVLYKRQLKAISYPILYTFYSNIYKGKNKQCIGSDLYRLTHRKKCFAKATSILKTFTIAKTAQEKENKPTKYSFARDATAPSGYNI